MVVSEKKLMALIKFLVILVLRITLSSERISERLKWLDSNGSKKSAD